MLSTVSIFYPITLHEQITYTWICQTLMIIYGGYISIRLLFLVISWWRLVSEKIYLPKELTYLDCYKNSIAKDLDIRKKIILHINKTEGSPFTWGWLKPLLSFPQLAVKKLSHLQIKSLLLHELIHIKKKDYLISIVLYIVDSLFFFNPFVKRWIKEIRFLQEVCCDKQVIKKYSVKEYIAALLLFTRDNRKISFLKISANYDLYNRIVLMLGYRKLKFNKKVNYSSFVNCAFLFLLVHHHNLSPISSIVKYQTMKAEKRELPFVLISKINVSNSKKTTSNITPPIHIKKIKCIDTQAIIVMGKGSKPSIEDVDASQQNLSSNEQHQYNDIHSISNKKYLIPEDINRDSLINSIISKATLILLYSKEIIKKYPYISTLLTTQQLNNIQLDNKSQESTLLLQYFIKLMHKQLQLHIEDFDWQMLNMKIDNEVVNIILKQPDYQ
ncbi:MAG: M56 family metallopeptidase [Chitinophagaceae bacterium]